MQTIRAAAISEGLELGDEISSSDHTEPDWKQIAKSNWNCKPWQSLLGEHPTLAQAHVLGDPIPQHSILEPVRRSSSSSIEILYELLRMMDRIVERMVEQPTRHWGKLAGPKKFFYAKQIRWEVRNKGDAIRLPRSSDSSGVNPRNSHSSSVAVNVVTPTVDWTSPLRRADTTITKRNPNHEILCATQPKNSPDQWN